MLLSRLLSGHLLLQSFGVIYLVTVFHYTLPQAALIFGPAQIGYVLGSLLGGIFLDQASKASPRYGRVLMLQLAQFFFAVVAFFGTQFNWGVAIFIAFFFAMFFLQGVNPGINRPIVYAVVPPALRGAAFAVMLSIVESIGWAIYNLLAGFLGQKFGLQPVFLAALIGVMLVNVAVIFVLYRTYWPDVQNLDQCGHCGSLLPHLPSPPQLARCSACQGDLRTCQQTRLSDEIQQPTHRYTQDLKMLLGPLQRPSEEAQVKMVGKQ